ncbi:putative carboxypeptidase S1 [Tothia fuscella]|uniref:Carboxypeptidase S1 n=1 Tax=Tothia fuscella TaxID=1048955 RepID=A0A9P4TY04_9PEZI|nr:putative carboxypeptidase S1 [Tothia fuscella]
MFGQLIVVVVLLFGVLASAQAPPKAVYDNVIESKVYPGVKISYKAPKICETTPNVKSYSGYISMPKGVLTPLNTTNDYPINLFFWFFESRKDSQNAPLAVWLSGAGGAGGSTMKSLFHGTGPCYVNPDSRSTTLNPNSWNNDANVLYVDQPNLNGFSYDQLVTTPRGVIASENAFATAQSTGVAARTMWVFMQTFLQEFTEFKPKNKAVGLWSTGYGGRWAPSFGAYFLRRSAQKNKNEVPINVETIGVVNGFIDMLVQQPTLPLFAFNNTYGIKAINQGDYQGVMKRYGLEDGCANNLAACRKAALADPENLNRSTDAGNRCAHASVVCSTVDGAYGMFSGRSKSDVTALMPDSFPPPYYIGYLNSRPVQQELGVPKNFTVDNEQVGFATDSYDALLGKPLEDMGFLLDRGVNVALLYGDRDYLNNWIGGEGISTTVRFNDTTGFKAAGYQNVQINASYIGGQVRQHARLSFARIYDAGNEAYAYQPETLQKLFQRAMSSKDIATGSVAATSSSYKTSGGSSTWSHKNKVPCSSQQICYILSPRTCTDLQLSAYREGYGITKDFVLTGYTPNVPDYLDPPYLKNKPKPAGC